MLRIKIPNQIPYGGRYVLDLPQRGLVGSGYNFESLLENVKKWRLANGLPNGLSLADELDKAICEKYTVECHETDPTIPVRHKRSWRDVLHGTTTMAATLIAGRQTVSQEVAIARGAICLNCPMKTTFSRPCGGNCPDLQKVVNSIVGAKTTPFDDKLDGQCCSICACYLTAAIWSPLEIQCRGVDSDQKAQFKKVRATINPACWKDCG